jgi:hypothetical protein
LAFLLEESLRLVRLPGEDQGRVYYFQKVSVPAIPDQASRAAWLGYVESALVHVARQAVHGSDPRAGSSNAIYFDNYIQCSEFLLFMIFRKSSYADWFWPLFNHDDRHVTRDEQILLIIERLREEFSSWDAVANVILSALDEADVDVLLSALPLPTVHTWLRELDNSILQKAVRPSTPTSLSTAQLLSQGAQLYGWSDARLLWLAAMAVIRDLKVSWTSGTAVRRAKTILYHLALEDRAFTGKESDLSSLFEKSVISLDGRAPDDESVPSADTNNNVLEVFVGDGFLSEGFRISPSSDHGRILGTDRRDRSQRDPVREFGKPTKAAGLYYLLNTVRRLGIEAVLQDHPGLAEASFVAHLLREIAREAQVDPEDPILDWPNRLGSEQRDFELIKSIAGGAEGKTMWPLNLLPMAGSVANAGYFFRAWRVGVRRWCWRNTRMTVRDIVHRDGWISLSPTDLDVTLSLSNVDIRIRRVGLDIDPGWLVWFGRVVRFHYRRVDPDTLLC